MTMEINSPLSSPTNYINDIDISSSTQQQQQQQQQQDQNASVLSESLISKYIRKSLNLQHGKVYIPPRPMEGTMTALSSYHDYLQQGIEFFTSSRIHRWTYHFFQCSFVTAIVYFVVCYYIIVQLFAFFIIGVSYYHENRHDQACMGENFPYDGPFRPQQEFAYSSSWTTFSTVGYGTISPPAQPNCRAIRSLLVAEAFLGVLYAGFCGAIFHNKVARINSQASVTFSSAICLTYGRGITPQKRMSL